MTEPRVSFAYAYSPRENDGSSGKYHVVTQVPLEAGRLRRAAGDALCKPARKFWGLDARSFERFQTYPCKRCKALAERLGLLDAAKAAACRAALEPEKP